MRDESIHAWLERHCMVPDDLQRLAERVRNAYVRYRRTLHPAYTGSAALEPTWLKAAQGCVEAGATPEEWVGELVSGPSQVWPNHLAGREAIAKWRQRRSTIDRARIERELAHYVAVFNQYVKYSEPSATLLDSKLGLHPLFTWCVARKLGLATVEAAVVDEARRWKQNNLYGEIYMKYFREVLREL